VTQGSQPASAAVGFWVSSSATCWTNGIIDSIAVAWFTAAAGTGESAGLKYVDSQGRHIQERQIHHFSKADPACGAGVARGLGLGG